MRYPTPIHPRSREPLHGWGLSLTLLLRQAPNDASNPRRFSRFISASGTPGQLLSRWGAGAYESVVSARLLQKVGRTLPKPYFRERHRPNQVTDALEPLRLYAVTTAVPIEVRGVAISARATLLVTGDRRLREEGEHRGVTILTPREFLDLLERGPA